VDRINECRKFKLAGNCEYINRKGNGLAMVRRRDMDEEASGERRSMTNE